VNLKKNPGSTTIQPDKHLTILDKKYGSKLIWLFHKKMPQVHEVSFYRWITLSPKTLSVSSSWYAHQICRL